MEKNAIEWIDPAAARRLLLEYRHALGVKGGSEIERQITGHTRMGISRKTIENWLRDPNSAPSPQTIKIVLRFLQTAHFQKIVPRTRDYLESEARLNRIGMALFDLYGIKDKIPSELSARNSLIHGWWTMPVFRYERNTCERNYVCITEISGYPFSRIQMTWNTGDGVFVDDQIIVGSGIIYSVSDDSLGRLFGARIWYEGSEKVLKFLKLFEDQDQLSIMYETPGELGSSTISSLFRAKENAIPDSLRHIFEDWRRNIIPQSAAHS